MNVNSCGLKVNLPNFLNKPSGDTNTTGIHSCLYSLPTNSFDTNHSGNYPPWAFPSCTRDWITHGHVSGATLSVPKQETDSCQQIQVVPIPALFSNITDEKTPYCLTLLQSRKNLGSPSDHHRIASLSVHLVTVNIWHFCVCVHLNNHYRKALDQSANESLCRSVVCPQQPSILRFHQHSIDGVRDTARLSEKKLTSVSVLVQP